MEIIYCKECGHPMTWHWSQGTYTPGAWVIYCNKPGKLGSKTDCCPMSGWPFSPTDYEHEFRAQRGKQVAFIYRKRRK